MDDPETIQCCVLLPGNNHMKEENYKCAVDCYTKAIDLDLRNAVYYCNRYSQQQHKGRKFMLWFYSLCSNLNVFPFKADVELNCLWRHFAKIWCFHWDKRCYWIYLSLCRTYLNVVMIKHCRAAAHSKLGNYTEATCDCERAIGIDPTYSKAYGRMGWVRLNMWGFVSLETIPPPPNISLYLVAPVWLWQPWASIQRQFPTSRKLWC